MLLWNILIFLFFSFFFFFFLFKKLKQKTFYQLLIFATLILRLVTFNK